MHLCIDIGNTRTKIGVFRYLPQKPDTPSGLVEMWAIKEPLEIEQFCENTPFRTAFCRR